MPFQTHRIMEHSSKFEVVDRTNPVYEEMSWISNLPYLRVRTLPAQRNVESPHTLTKLRPQLAT